MTDEQRTRVSGSIVGRIVADLTDRRGLRQEWESIDEDVRQEIMETWGDIVQQEIAKVQP
jgi:hypothetical protein